MRVRGKLMLLYVILSILNGFRKNQSLRSERASIRSLIRRFIVSGNVPIEIGKIWLINIGLNLEGFMNVKRYTLFGFFAVLLALMPLTHIMAADLLPPQQAIETASTKLQHKMQDKTFIKDFS